VNGIRLSLLPRGADAAAAVAVAESADRRGLDGFWYGEAQPGGAPVPDDAYVLTALCGAAARTRDIRLGALLDLTPDRAPLTSAEDIGVLDQASGGRLELGLRPAPDDGWADRAALILDAWNDWPVTRCDVVITPRPAQPRIPRLVVSGLGGDGVRERLGAGMLVVGPPTAPGEFQRPGRTVLLSELAPPAGDADTTVEAITGYVHALRDDAAAAGADEVVVVAAAEIACRDRFVELLAGVVAPSLRCPRADMQLLLYDSMRWWRRRS
jgi:alkanesulfonate monooxygenase SsuD/methylene tetrahydromethanopterin reductase-like flavin-dependent oxidoreductase (luciferase family)